ncbi:unnamed protein product, partial [Phaeothamnion confervicola]
LRWHPLWRNAALWEQALQLGVWEQLAVNFPKTARWDDLNAEARREAVVRVHNTVFAELGMLGLNMLEYGCPPEAVLGFVSRKCVEAQLAEDQVQALVRDLHRRVGLQSNG